MAGFSFLSSILPTALSAASTIGSIARAKNEYDTRNQDIQQAVNIQQEQQRVESEKEATARRESLRRAVARQRAAFGAQGISSNEGSAEAILLGLTQQSDTEQAQQDALDQLRTQALQENAATQQRKNLLALNSLYDKSRLSSLLSD